MKTIALCNQKGGVGKTTTTYWLAWALVNMGKRVLVLDIDPQGNTTSSLTPDLSRSAEGLADVLSDRSDASMRDVVTSTIWQHVDIAPTPNGNALIDVRGEIERADVAREQRLKNAIMEFHDEYDVALIDCPPSLDQLTINALVAADSVLIITEPKKFSLDGLAALLKTIELIREHYNYELAIDAVVPNKADKRTRNTHDWLEVLQQFGENTQLRVLSAIPLRVVISDCAEASASPTDFPNSSVAEVIEIYKTLASEVTRETTTAA